MKAVKATVAAAAATILMTGCTPDWAKQGNSQAELLMTAINGGNVLDSDVAISSGSVCPDEVPLRLENHFKNPSVTATGFRHDIVVQSYQVRYFRSDGRNVEGVDVPYTITGNVSQEVIQENDATLNIEVVRRQAKLEPPLRNLVDGATGGLIVTMFAEITLYGVDNTGQVTNPVTGRMQIDFANFGDTLTACPTT